MDEYKIVVSQEESPASLTTHEILRSAPELKIAMISDNFERLKQAFEIHAPILECFGDSKHFTVVDLVVTFGFVYRLRSIRNRVPVSVFTLLVDDATCSESGGIDFNSSESLRCPNG
jgi:hypothetical protein